MANEISKTMKETSKKDAAKVSVKKPVKKSASAKTVSKAVKSTAKAKVTKKSVKSVASTTKKAPVKVEKTSTEDKSFAVIEIAGTQLKVVAGGKYEINKIDGDKGDFVSADLYKVLMTSNGEDAKLGTTYIENTGLQLKIDSQKKGEKIETRKFKSKARYRRKVGFRPLITRIEVTKLS